MLKLPSLLNATSHARGTEGLGTHQYSNTYLLGNEALNGLLADVWIGTRSHSFEKVLLGKRVCIS